MLAEFYRRAKVQREEQKIINSISLEVSERLLTTGEHKKSGFYWLKTIQKLIWLPGWWLHTHYFTWWSLILVSSGVMPCVRPSPKYDIFIFVDAIDGVGLYRYLISTAWRFARHADSGRYGSGALCVSTMVSRRPAHWVPGHTGLPAAKGYAPRIRTATAISPRILSWYVTTVGWDRWLLVRDVDYRSKLEVGLMIAIIAINMVI